MVQETQQFPENPEQVVEDRPGSAENVSPLPDDGLALLLGRMQLTQLGTDQCSYVADALESHTVTCQQAAQILKVVKIGILQRHLLLKVFQGRLVDASSDFFNLVLEPLPTLIQDDARIAFGQLLEDDHLAQMSYAALNEVPLKPQKTLKKRRKLKQGGHELQVMPPRHDEAASLTACVERLRDHVTNYKDLPEPLVRDIDALFLSLGLSPLQCRISKTAGATSGGTGETGCTGEAPEIPNSPAAAASATSQESSFTSNRIAKSRDHGQTATSPAAPPAFKGTLPPPPISPPRAALAEDPGGSPASPSNPAPAPNLEGVALPVAPTSYADVEIAAAVDGVLLPQGINLPGQVIQNFTDLQLEADHLEQLSEESV
eukprot:TRINITY_DN115054_c0_g1_i1.p1 TRINITY_DN115054_c0_g1~~TRINITY_DN115054_c0_g1_i1.p1  ORF type:complete len:374 (+),score=74.14 TRINITY_DN115054_c0_g1_i1:135-1256(+)